MPKFKVTKSIDDAVDAKNEQEADLLSEPKGTLVAKRAYVKRLPPPSLAREVWGHVTGK